MASNAVRLSENLIREARNEASIMSRSITSQVEHWAKLGRLVEKSPSINYDNVRRALMAEYSPDALSAAEQELFHVELSEFLERSAHPELDDVYADMRTRHAQLDIDPAALGD